MSVANSTIGALQASLEPFLAQFARLAEADAISLLAIDLGSAGEFWELLPSVSLGCVDKTHPALEFRALFPDVDHTSASRPLSSEMVARLCSSGSCRFALASPILDQDSQHPAGAAIMLFASQPAEEGRAQAALALLVQLVLRHLARERTLGNLELALESAKRLSARHVVRHELERELLAREIHDDLSQSVTFIRLAVTSLQRQLDAGNLERARTDVVELLRASIAVNEAIQKISSGLRPALIELLGPVPAIRQECALHSQATGVAVTCVLAAPKVPPAVALALYRIVQTCLSNIARHAKATAISIELTTAADELVLTVKDDGCGFDAPPYAQSPGLLSLRERAEIVGGTLIIKTRPGEGTVVIATFPRNLSA